MNSLFVCTTTQQIKKQNIFGSHPLAIILFFSSLLSWLTRVVVVEHSELRDGGDLEWKIVPMWNEIAAENSLVKRRVAVYLRNQF